MQAFRYFLSQGSFSTKLDSKALAIVLLFTLWHGPCCFKCHQPCTPHYCQLRTQNPAMYHSFALFLWYFVLVEIYERRHKSSIFCIIWACKLVCLLGVILEKDQETWLPACNSAYFWGACYSTKSCCLEHSFEAWLLYCRLASEVFGHGRDFASKRLWGFGA